jgi:hypothetical protein
MPGRNQTDLAGRAGPGSSESPSPATCAASTARAASRRRTSRRSSGTSDPNRGRYGRSYPPSNLANPALVERLGRGTATDLARASVAELVAHYLDPARRPARVERWSDRHRDEQVRYCERYVLPVLGAMACRRLTRVDVQRVLDQAPPPRWPSTCGAV